MLQRPRNTGSAISEFGPALFFVLLVIFFPLLNLAMVGLTYFCCSTLTDLQAEKAALLPRSQAEDAGGPVKSALPSVWMRTGMGAFAKLSQTPQTRLSYPIIGVTRHVQVTTNFSASPFMPIPFIPGVPGISSPLGFNFSSKRVLEDPKNYDR